MTIKRIMMFILVMAVSINFIACSDTEGEENKSAEKRAVSVEVKTMEGISFSDYINVVGVVNANQSANVSFEGTGGQLKAVKKDKGSFVKEGEVVLEIENDILKANYNAAKAQYDLAQMTFEKQEQIFKENVNSEFQYLQSKYQRDQAKAGYDLAKTSYEKSFVKAPFDGFINQRFFDVGEFAAPGVPLFQIIDDNSLKIIAGIPERYADDVKLNQNVEIFFPELDLGKIEGKISFISKALNPDNRTFEVEIRISNKNRSIKPEMLAELKIFTRTYDNVVVVPEDVVTKIDDGYVVYTVSDGKAVQKKVDIIKRTNGQVAISNGLVSGEKVITVGYQNIVEGENVNIVN